MTTPKTAGSPRRPAPATRARPAAALANLLRPGDSASTIPERRTLAAKPQPRAPAPLPKRASLIAGCALARPALDGCAWCGGALPPRRRTWCSDRCSTTFWTNHWWTLARSATKRRDKYRCRACGAAAPKRPSRSKFAGETAYRIALRAWRKAKRNGRMEVNHRVPCRGKHGTLSCDHHLDNLETLCMACHRVRTDTDRKAGALAATG